MNNIFNGSNSLSSLIDLSIWNTKNVNNMSFIFYNCDNLGSMSGIFGNDDKKNLSYNQNDISKWNTLNAKYLGAYYKDIPSLLPFK